MPLLRPGQAERRHREDHRIVGAEEHFEVDEQRNGQQIGRVDHACSRILPRKLTRLVSTFRLGSGSSLMDEDLYLISMAARLLGMHPQTLRKYERLGLIHPSRTIGSMRLYSREELERLRLIKHLVDDAGINLAGGQRRLAIAEVVQRTRPRMPDEALAARHAPPRPAHE